MDWLWWGEMKKLSCLSLNYGKRDSDESTDPSTGWLKCNADSLPDPADHSREMIDTEKRRQNHLWTGRAPLVGP